ncbi:hypothetical protein IE81DRAFT_321404 [Ceraceosorus guamensis]|uniref:Uncharacterized protein n=1 Tax=Ceraceosorus guamensis TaxID=1522189 RepID=A0A316W392_9BASI|nr:hypothetical protein IE81DRAFT_321404 [Ceraceosorus guamensis]PWN44260.1 hypothetical protein IE81DRAFT_321404 [Ceraceosorus guamensis]
MSSFEGRGPSSDAQFSSYIVWIQERDRLRTETEALPWVSWLCLGVHVGTMLAQASNDGKMLKYWKRPAVFTYFVIRAFATANFTLAVLWCSVGGQSDMTANIVTIMYFVCETITQGAILVAFLLRTLILWHSHLVLLDVGFFLWIAVSAFHLVNCFTYHFAGSPYDLRIVYALPPRFGFLRFGPYFADFGFTCLVTALTIVGSGRYAKRHLVGSFHSITERNAQEKATRVANSILSHQLIFFAISALATAVIGSLGLAEAFNGYSALIRLPIGLLMQSTMACALIQNLRRLQQDGDQARSVLYEADEFAKGRRPVSTSLDVTRTNLSPDIFIIAHPSQNDADGLEPRLYGLPTRRSYVESVRTAHTDSDEGSNVSQEVEQSWLARFSR